ncbi:MAG: hypothetical protein K2X27_25080 [Candidatus Obscuribacterales bacterium]|nr:hypothetical protein [Candidatus Obscuribacterales bacterium]
MSTAEQKKLKLAYEGSVKRVWQCPWQEDALLFEFSDDYSIFDWGKMPDRIQNKGLALTVFGAVFFQKLASPSFWQDLGRSKMAEHLNKDYLKTLFENSKMQELEKKGLESHFLGLLNENGESLSISAAAASDRPVYMMVRKALVQRPEAFTVLQQNIFAYPRTDTSAKTRLIPLEIVFRFGMPQGSSLKARLEKDPSYAKVLGLGSLPKEGQFFERPVLEFYTKLEPKDRLLSLQEALLISGLSKEEFTSLSEIALLSALALFKVFAERGIELWDGKFEFLLHEGRIVLADSIGPDELRLLYKGTHFSKEIIRQVYRDSAWEKALKESQKLAAERCSLDWKAICKNELKESPPKFKPEVKNVLDKLYGSLANVLSGETLFAEHPNLDEFVASAEILKAQNCN